jgi:iron complex outermembrane receptor protein
MLTNPVFNYHNISAAIGLTYDINNKNKVLTNVSMAMRPPNPAELFSEGLHHSAARIEIGDLRNDQETSYRWSGTYNYQSYNTNVVVEAFYNYINNYIVIEPTGTEQTIRGAFPVWQYRQTNAQLFGIDLSATHKFSERFSFSNKSSFIKGYEINNDRPLIDIPAVRTINSIEFNKAEWNNFNTTLTSEFVFRQNEFPDNNFEQFIAAEDTFVLVDVSTPPAAYHLLNWKAGVDFKISKKSILNANLSVNNILNTNYRDYLNRLRYFADDLGRNVMLQLKVNY